MGLWVLREEERFGCEEQLWKTVGRRKERIGFDCV
jgi:hypothetical protein